MRAPEGLTPLVDTEWWCSHRDSRLVLLRQRRHQAGVLLPRNITPRAEPGSLDFRKIFRPHHACGTPGLRLVGDDLDRVLPAFMCALRHSLHSLFVQGQSTPNETLCILPKNYGESQTGARA